MGRTPASLPVPVYGWFRGPKRGPANIRPVVAKIKKLTAARTRAPRSPALGLLPRARRCGLRDRDRPRAGSDGEGARPEVQEGDGGGSPAVKWTEKISGSNFPAPAPF